MSPQPHDDYGSVYRDKLRPVGEVVERIQPDDVIAAPLATGQPAAFLSALDERKDYHNLSIFSGLLIEPYPVLQQSGVRLVSGFYGPVERMLKAAGAHIEYLPADFLGWEHYAERVRPRVVASAVAPMDEDGFLSLGLHAGATFAAFRAAARDSNRVAIAEVVRDMPVVYGLEPLGAHRIHISELDYVIESDRSVFTLADIETDDDDRAIAGYVADLVEDGSTLQIGIGGVPNIVAQLLAEGRKGDFGIHTEMIVDGIMRLHQAGKVTNRKGLFDGFSIGTFAAGSGDLYRWMARNPEVRLLPVGEVNDPAVIRRNRRMVSINGALAIDLAGQIMADTVGPRQYSGVGGHELFVVGAGDARDGKSIICLHSTATVNGRTVSSIVATLPLGTPVTTPRHHVQYVVTEHGVANLGLLTDAARAQALIAIADPAFRDELRAATRA